MFPNSVIFYIIGGQSFALTGTRADNWDGTMRTLDDTDTDTALLFRVFWEEFVRIGAFSRQLATEIGK